LFANEQQNILQEIHRGFLSITIHAFASARDSFGFSTQIVSCTPNDTPFEIVQRLVPRADITGMRPALDLEYVSWDTPVGSAKELAIIPPVSGG
jgi:molybdopterin synthase sulfur carrier subunit